MFLVNSNGNLSYNSTDKTASVRPVLYLKSNIKIKSNSASDYGSESNPFVIDGVS